MNHSCVIMIYMISFIKHKNQQRIAVLKILKNPKIQRTQVDVQVRLWLKNCCLKMKIYTSELLNLSVETMNSIVEDIIDLLLDESNLSSPYRSVFVIHLSCFFKMFPSIFLILIKGALMQIWKSVNIFVFTWRQCDEDFTLKHLLHFEMCAREICKKFVYKHSKAIEYVKN